jgi:hypothetical protein
MVMDCLCGVLGLRFHPQFIQELLNENFVAFHDEKRTHNYVTSAVQKLDSIKLNQPGIDIITRMFPDLGKVEAKVTQKSSRILGWLIRAWAERDIIAKFNALFIPLEMILDDVSGALSEDLSSHIQALQDFIQSQDAPSHDALRRWTGGVGKPGSGQMSKNGLLSQILWCLTSIFLPRRCAQGRQRSSVEVSSQGGEETERLSKSLKEVVSKIRPSLIDRFNTFADQAKMPGYENDKVAFKMFNRIRNGLLHRGDPNVKIHVPVGEEVQALEDLTERYVNYYLFGDTNVYQSSFLPRPKPPAS